MSGVSLGAEAYKGITVQGISIKGRPPKDGKFRPIYDHALYSLLREKLPNRFTKADGRLDTVALAQEMDLSRQTLYRWFKGERLSTRLAKDLIAISNNAECERKGAITEELLTPFITNF